MFLPIKRWIKPSIVVNAMQQSTVFLILYEMFKVVILKWKRIVPIYPHLLPTYDPLEEILAHRMMTKVHFSITIGIQKLHFSNSTPPKRQKGRLIKVAPLMKQPFRLCTNHQLKWVFESVRLVIVLEVIIKPSLFVVLVIPYL